MAEPSRSEAQSAPIGAPVNQNEMIAEALTTLSDVLVRTLTQLNGVTMAYTRDIFQLGADAAQMAHSLSKTGTATSAISEQAIDDAAKAIDATPHAAAVDATAPEPPTVNELLTDALAKTIQNLDLAMSNAVAAQQSLSSLNQAVLARSLVLVQSTAVRHGEPS